MTDNELIGDKTSPRVIGIHLIPTLVFKGLVRMFVPELSWGGGVWGQNLQKLRSALSKLWPSNVWGSIFVFLSPHVW